MKDHLNAILRSFVCALVCAALGALCIALMLALYDFDRTVHLAIGVWVGLIAAQSVLCEIMVARGASMLMYILVNGALYAFGVDLLLERTVFIPGSSGFPVLLGMLCAAGGLACAAAAQKEPGSNVFVRCADALILGISVYLGTAYALHDAVIPPIVAFSLCALILSMLMTAALRAGGESDSVIRGTGVGGWLVLLALLGLCLLFTGGIIGVSSGHINSLVDVIRVIWQLLCRLGMISLHLLARFLSLFAGQYKHVRIEPAFETPDPAEFEAIMPMDAPAWIVHVFFAAILAALAAMLVVIIRLLAGTKLKRARAVRRRRRITRTSHLFSSLRAMLSSAAAAIAFETAYRFGPPSPQRLFVLATRTGRLHRLPKRRGETPGSYLRRYHLALSEQQSPSSLADLADMLDTALYGGVSPCLSRSKYERFAAQIGSLRSAEKPSRPVQNP